MDTSAKILSTVKQYWGFERLWPLQEEAILAGLEGRDSLVVMPTGGGKSLCYQVPPAMAGRTDIVVSPLISLMKDQVDGLRACGYPAAAIYGSMSFGAMNDIFADLQSSRIHLLFLSPERLFNIGFLQQLKQLQIRSFAVDEAHCVSHWGHDFRPEYRRLAHLKDEFPEASIHAYTATATEHVRRDVIEQLGLRDPQVLVGDFDRPNLVYRMVPRVNAQSQVLDIVRRHSGQAVIVYCISRKNTERMADGLKAAGINAAHYHAGMGADLRRRTQDAFAQEKLDVVVATVAFGMGIDRSDVRCVIHSAMPKSVEHYQQETGRAGRDGLEAECVLLYSPADAMRWESLITKSTEEAGCAPDVLEAALHQLRQMQNYADSIGCRHQALVEYFGQSYAKSDCGACDACLDEIPDLVDGTVMAQKILSCVARTGERFGVGHVVEVLRGSKSERISDLGHDQLSTYGLLQEIDGKSLTNVVYQLVNQGALERTPGDRPILCLCDASWEIMRGRRDVRLRTPPTKAASPVKKTLVEAESWAGVDRDLFEELRSLRREIADERGVPPYVVFPDTSLREFARLRPVHSETFLQIHGVGVRKLRDFAPAFIARIKAHAEARGLSVDVMD